MSKNDFSTDKPTKQCSKCLECFPNTSAFFYRKNGRCKLCVKIVAKAWAKANPEKRKASVKKWDKDHKEYIRIKNKEWSIKNHEKRKEQLKAWRKKNTPRYKETYTAWRKNNYPQYYATQKATADKRRAAKLHAPINNFTRAQWETIKIHYHFRCVYCGKKPKRLTMDHITPLSKGGSHTYSNIVPACTSCNSKKKNNPPPIPVQPLLLL